MRNKFAEQFCQPPDHLEAKKLPSPMSHSDICASASVGDSVQCVFVRVYVCDQEKLDRSTVDKSDFSFQRNCRDGPAEHFFAAIIFFQNAASDQLS